MLGASSAPTSSLADLPMSASASERSSKQRQVQKPQLDRNIKVGNRKLQTANLRSFLILAA